MLSNEVFALTCREYYEEQGLVVDASNGQFAHCPLPERYGDTGYYLLWEHHQQQGLLQSRDIDECCFFIGHAKEWLRTCEIWPDNYFELWDIYEKYSSIHSRGNMRILHEGKNENGQSVFALNASKKANAEKNKEGKSVNAVKGGKKSAEKFNQEKNEEGKSVFAVKGGRAVVNQVWESTQDGFRSHAAVVARHNKTRGWDPGARIRIS